MKDRLQSPETIQTAQTSTEQKLHENKKGRKNIHMDMSKDKQAISHTRKLGHG